MSKPHNPWSTEESIEVMSTEALEVGQVERYGVFYPYDGFLSAGFDREYAESILADNKRHFGLHTKGAYLVKYSIERVED